MHFFSNPYRRARIFKMVYLLTMGILLASIIATPLMIEGKLALSDRIVIEENMLQMLLITAMLIAAFLTTKLYENRLREYQKKIGQLSSDRKQLSSSLSEAYHYIGTVNAELLELQKIFCDLDRYPQSKNDLKMILNMLADKAMALSRSDWLIIRIIGQDNFRTLKECRQGEFKGELSPTQISNRAIMAGEKIEGLSIIGPRQRTPLFKTVCIARGGVYEPEARLMIEAIAGIAEMIFIIYASGCMQQN
jgi:hypothetical protein